MSLKRKVILVFLFLIIIPFLLVGWSSYKLATKKTVEQVALAHFEVAKQNLVMLTETVTSVNQSTLKFIDSELMKTHTKLSDLSTLKGYKKVENSLNSYSNESISFSLYLDGTLGNAAFPHQTDKYKSRGIYWLDAKESWFVQSIQDGGSGGIRFIPQSGSGVLDKNTVAFTRLVKDYEDDLPLGVLSVSNLESLFYRTIYEVELPKGGEIYYITEDGTILATTHRQTNIVGSKFEHPQLLYNGSVIRTIGGERLLFSTASDFLYHTQLVYVVPVSSIVGSQQVLLQLFEIMSIVYLFIVLLFVLYLLRSVMVPIQRLAFYVRKYQPGMKKKDWSGFHRKDEIGQLIQAFADMTERLNEEIEEKYGLKLKQKETELMTLHSQITPHLLYNTLDSIYWYGIKSGMTDMSNMVRDLASLLRIGLSKGRALIPLEEELEHVRAYLRLQLKRYENSFQVHWELDDSLKGLFIPKVIIQPIVENCILHGVGKMDGEGEIWIRTHADANELILEIEDNGFKQVNLEKIQAILSGTGESQTGGGYGLRNVHQRIRLHFGDGYGLRYGYRSGGGTKAIICLPLMAVHADAVRSS